MAYTLQGRRFTACTRGEWHTPSAEWEPVAHVLTMEAVDALANPLGRGLVMLLAEEWRIIDRETGEILREAVK